MKMINKLLAAMGLVREADVASLRKQNTNLSSKIDGLEEQLDLKTALVESLEKQLKEAKLVPVKEEKKPSEMKMKYKVGYVEAKRRLKKRSLTQLRAALEKVPNNTGGFGGTAIVYRDKQVEAINFRSKQEALQIVSDAEAGKLHLVF